MLKRLLRYFSFSICLFLIISCAPKVAPPPTVSIEHEYTLEEIVEKVSAHIEVIKAIAEINVDRNGEHYNFVKTSVLIKQPDWVHMRMYQLGMLVKDFVIKGDILYALTGRKDEKLKKLSRELHYAIFWWDHFSSGTMFTEKDEYIIIKDNKRIHLDKATLLPVKQEVEAIGSRISITYSSPKEYIDFWYPSYIEIAAGEYLFKVRLKKIVRNPALGEFDFRTPEAG